MSNGFGSNRATTRADRKIRGGNDMKTSEETKELGLYSSQCCSEELIFDKGDTFCRCPRCESLRKWEHVEELVRMGDLEEVIAQAA